jgi:hypothetical protein
MLLVSRERKVVTTIPLLFLAVSLLCAFGAFAYVAQEVSWQSALGVLATLGLFALTATQTRRIRAVGKQLVVTTPFGTKRLSIDSLSLGIRVTVTRGHTTYHLYALDDAREVELLTSSSRKRGESYKELLTQLYLSGRMDPQAAQSSVAEIARREARRKSDVAQTSRLRDQYSGWSKFFVVAAIVTIAVVAIFSIGFAVYILKLDGLS